MKRIKPEEVQAAYRETGIQPSQGIWFGKPADDESVCGCGMGVLLVQAGYKDAAVWMESGSPLPYAGAPEPIERSTFLTAWLLGLDLDYVRGFIQGFDTDVDAYEDSDPSEAAERGFTDGDAARDLVMNLGAVEG